MKQQDIKVGKNKMNMGDLLAWEHKEKADQPLWCICT